MRESAAVEGARRALGAQLAAYRRAAGYNQVDFARLVGYSRSTVANVETGRQNVPPGFWESADEAVRAAGALVAASGEIEASVRRERESVARRGDPFVLALARGYGAVGIEPQGQGGTASSAGADGGWLDAIAVAASEAREHAEKVAVTEIGPATVEQLTADVVRLGRAYVSAPPLPLFAAMHQGLSQIRVAIDQKAYPAQARDLSFLAGALCGLMANASLDLGREEAAEDLARAAWTYGRVIDHGPLMGWARGTQALAAIWDHRYLDAARHAADGLAWVSAGTGAVRLHAIQGRALAAQGDHAEARVAMTAAGKAAAANAEARGVVERDELHDGIGGEFAFDEAKLSYYQALTLVDIEDPAEAAIAADVAIGRYQAIPARVRSYGCEALARVQLARAQLMNGKLDDAVDSLAGVLALSPQRRISSLNQYLEHCRQLLGSPAFRGSGTAREFGQELAAFSDGSTARALPGG